MKLRPLILTVAVFLLAAGLAFWANRPPPSAPSDPRVGQPVIDPSVVAAAGRLRLSAQGRTIDLVRQPDGSWRDESYFGLPADFSKLSDLARGLTSAKVDRFVTDRPDRLARLGFGDTRIESFDAAGRPLVSVEIGKEADSGGHFVRFGDAARAYLADLNTWIDSDPKAWADSALLALAPETIAEVRLPFPSAPTLTLRRAKPGDPWRAEGLPGRKVDDGRVGAVLSVIGSLRFSDTSAPDDPAAAAARRGARVVTLVGFDGAVTTLAFGRAPAAKPAKPSSPAPPAAPVYVFIASSQPKAPINALMRRRSFQIDDYAFTSLPASPDELLAPLPPPSAGSEKR